MSDTETKNGGTGPKGPGSMDISELEQKQQGENQEEKFREEIRAAIEKFKEEMRAAIENHLVETDQILLAGDTNVDLQGENKSRIKTWNRFLEDYELEDHVMNHVTHEHVSGTQNELDRAIAGEGRQYRVSTKPFQSLMALMMTDFSNQSKSEVRAYAQVYTGDFYRDYTAKKCLACGSRTKEDATCSCV